MEVMSTEITSRLQRAAPGGMSALDALMPNVYETLCRLARRERQREAAHTLQTTALVHESCLVLMNQQVAQFDDRAHFFAYVSQVMRHVLVDHARRHQALKRQAPADWFDDEQSRSIIDILALDEAFEQLATIDARLARVARLKLFAGLSNERIADILEMTSRTVERDWLKARTFLSGCLLSPT